MGETQVGLQARLMSQALRKLAGNLNRAKTVCLFTNQIREKIGVSFGIPGDPAGRPGAEVLLLAATRPAPDRDPQGGHRGGRQPGPGEGGQEQGRGAVQARPSSTSSTASASRSEGCLLDLGARARPGPEVGLVLLLRRAAPRPGPQQREGVPGREPRAGRRDRGQDLRRARDRARAAPARRAIAAGPRRPRRPKPAGEGEGTRREEGRLRRAGRWPTASALSRWRSAALAPQGADRAELRWLRERGVDGDEAEAARRPPDRDRRARRRALRPPLRRGQAGALAAGARSGSARRCSSAASRSSAVEAALDAELRRRAARAGGRAARATRRRPRRRRRARPRARLPDPPRLRATSVAYEAIRRARSDAPLELGRACAMRALASRSTRLRERRRDYDR